MNINIDEAAIKRLVSESILAQLTPEKREEILKSAIAWIVDPEERRGTYGDKTYHPSPIEKAFREQLGYECNRLAREVIESDDSIKAKLRDLLAKAAEKALADEKMIEQVASAISRGLVGERY